LGVFERFTERARLVVVLAQEEARALGHHHIGTEHLLLGLLREEEGVAARVLGSLDITVERARDHVGVQVVAPGTRPAGGQVPFTPRAKKVLELALRESLSLGNNYIGTEHLLLGLIHESDGGVGFRTRLVPELEREEKEGVAHRILLDFDADSEKIRNEIIRVLAQDLPARDPNRSTTRSGKAHVGGSSGALPPGRLVVRFELNITPPPAGVEQLHQVAIDAVQRIYEDAGAELHRAGVHLIDRESGPSTTSEPDDGGHEPPAQS
jgi:ATP-dependent Clp protease ATP-binding subunit ClpC